MHWAAKKRLGVVAIQETMSLGEQERVMKDPLGEKWMLHTAGGGHKACAWHGFLGGAMLRGRGIQCDQRESKLD